MMVNVGANVGPYVAGMNTAGAATGRFATQAAGARTAAAGLGTTAVGSAARFLGPAGLVLGLSHASSAAQEFQSSTIALRTQIGLTEAQSQEMAEASRRVGVEFGVGGQAAVDASWQIASAGLRGEDALDALEAAARASAVGFGDMTTIADLATSAVNAYGAENLSASRATEILAAAVREGKAEPQEMAASMGQVLPIATEMGVSFEELAGTVAAMTRTGTNAATANTQLRQAMMDLLNPSQRARETLEAYGLSAEGLRAQIRDEGLLPTLMGLKDAFGDNEEAMSSVFSNARSLMGVLDLLGSNLEANQQVVDNVTNSHGLMTEAFEEFERASSRFQWDRLRANISETALSFGLELDPAIREVLRLMNLLYEGPTLGDRPLLGIDASGQARSVQDFLRSFVDPFGDLRAYVWDEVESRRSGAASDESVAAQTARWQGLADAYRDAGGAAAGASGPQSQFADGVQLVADASDRAQESLADYLDEVRAATDPMFALRQAVENVDDAQQAYNDAVEEHGETSAEARAASWELFEALTELERAALDGELSFADFERELQRFVDMGMITEAQADDIRRGVENLNSEVRLFDGEYTATLVADDQASTVVDTLIARLGRVQGTYAARLTLQAEQVSRTGTSSSTNRTPTSSVGGSSRGTSSMVKARGSGGPFWDGMTSLVGEHGPELVTFAGSGRVVPANQTAQMVRGSDGAAQKTLNVYGSPDHRTLFRARDMWETV
jgi:TP901 family phage tail tape measure protein